jgi:hypothetical protein
MAKMTKVAYRTAILLLVVSLVSGSTHALWAQQTEPGGNPGTATLEGRVFGADRVTPVPGGIVRAVRGDGVQVYSSLPADEKGAYSIKGLVLGNYDILVELPDGVFLVERTIGLTEAKVYPLSLATVPSANVEKRVAAVDKPVNGYAWTLEGKGPKAAGFWRTPGGIAIIAGGAAAVIALALSGGGNDNNKGSNSTP